MQLHYSMTDPSTTALDRLTPWGWSRGLVVILVALAATFFLFGYFAIYWRSADMDFMVVYNAIVMNDGRPQWFFDHPGYFTILSVKVWFQVLHILGLLDAYSLPAFATAVDEPTFGRVMTAAVRAARLVAWTTASLGVLLIALLYRAVLRDWRVALLATTAFAFSGGVMLHIRVLRSEMIAACLVFLALLILILAARRATLWRPLVLGGAALLCMLSVENKVQPVFLVGAWPVAILAFGTEKSRSLPFWSTRAAWFAVALSAAFAVLAGMAAFPLLATGLDPAVAASAGLKPLVAGTFGTYQAALVCLTGISLVAFAAIWKVNVAETLTSAFSIIAGVAIGLLALNLVYNTNNVVAVVNPIEKMLVFAGLDDSGGGRDLGSMVTALANNAIGVLKRYTYFFRTSARPAVFIVWLIIPGIVYAWRCGARQTAIQAILLMLIAFGFDVLGNQRGLGLPLYYTIFTDPLIILAGGLLLVQVPEIWNARFAFPIGVALLSIHLAFSQAEPIKRMLSRNTPEAVCDWHKNYLPLLTIPWCEAPARR